MNQLLKKISALIIAVIMSISLCLNTAVSVKATVIPIDPGAEFALNEILIEILGAFGMDIPGYENGNYTGSTLDLSEYVSKIVENSNPEEFESIYESQYLSEQLKSLKPSVVDFLENYADYYKTGLGVLFGDWIKSHANSVEAVEVDNIDMAGYGAVAVFHISDKSTPNKPGRLCIFYGAYGTIQSYIGPSNYPSLYFLIYNGNGLKTRQYNYFYSNNSESNYYASDPQSFNIDGSYSVAHELYGDWRKMDGTPYENVAEPTTTTIPNIADFEDKDGNTCTVSPDGVVTDSKGNTYPLNNDGSVTIGDDVYHPEIDYSLYDIKALMDLVNQIAKSIPGTIPGEKDKEKEKDNSYVDDLIDSIPYPDAIEGFESLQMPVVISQVFPFCLPFDFVRGLQLLSEKPVAPKIKMPFTIPEFGEFKGLNSTYDKNGEYVNVYYQDGKYYIEVDFAKYDKYFNVVRWFFTALFVFALIFISTKIIKGAGA